MPTTWIIAIDWDRESHRNPNRASAKSAHSSKKSSSLSIERRLTSSPRYLLTHLTTCDQTVALWRPQCDRVQAPLNETAASCEMAGDRANYTQHIHQSAR